MPHPENIPQIMAYVSEANILYYGGAAGGGKSDLLLGLATTAHKKSIIFRREFPQLRELVDRSAEILEGTGAHYTQTYTRWTGIPGGRRLEFGAVQHEKDREKYKGRPHDLKGFDEIPDFTEEQFRFLIAWNRSTDPNSVVESYVLVTLLPMRKENGLYDTGLLGYLMTMLIRLLLESYVGLPRWMDKM